MSKPKANETPTERDLRVKTNIEDRAHELTDQLWKLQQRWEKIHKRQAERGDPEPWEGYYTSVNWGDVLC